jgi:hypothetical protein
VYDTLGAGHGPYLTGFAVRQKRFSNYQHEAIIGGLS